MHGMIGMGRPKIISRAEARKRGLRRYFTGKQCKRGHIAERHTRDGCCHDCRRIFKQIWARKNSKSRADVILRWRVKNREKVRGYSRRASAKWIKKNRKRAKEIWDRYYVLGPSKPRGEKQWVKKSRMLLRTAGRINRKRLRGRRLSSIEKYALTLMSSPPVGLFAET